MTHCQFCGRFMKKCPNGIWTCQHSKPVKPKGPVIIYRNWKEK